MTNRRSFLALTLATSAVAGAPMRLRAAQPRLDVVNSPSCGCCGASADQPAALGLAVPGMPIGSPGMEMGGRVDAYGTLLVGLDGAAAVFASHG